MTHQPNEPFKISVEHLGPIISLDCELSKNAQNLVFARNGTGKSFLSRAFRFLDSHRQGKDIQTAPHDLVSEESPNKSGKFRFLRGATSLGELALDNDNDEVIPDNEEKIFHVFSEDFIQDELRDRSYEINGDITNEITIGSENSDLKEAQEEQEKIEIKRSEAFYGLQKTFNEKKNDLLKKKANVSGQLNAYKQLSLELYLEGFQNKPDKPAVSLSEIQADLDCLKSIPSDAEYLEEIEHFSLDDLDLNNLILSLKKNTSPANIAEDIKKKFDEAPDFFKTGVDLVKSNNMSDCPFCEQDITAPNVKRVIDTYISYFEGEEEKHKEELRQYWQAVKSKLNSLTKYRKSISAQKLSFDKLKFYISSQKHEELSDCSALLDQLETSLSELQESVKTKGKNPANPCVVPAGDVLGITEKINEAREENNTKVRKLNEIVIKVDEERKSLQRRACDVFKKEFVRDHWGDIEQLGTFEINLKKLAEKIKDLENLGPSQDAKRRVSKTFMFLLGQFFGDKYSFNEENFTLSRGDVQLNNGNHRRLSDGEKSAIAFCYFIASIHCKVTSNSDYENLFLVFDDPVTSMSYDFIFSIVQTLKNMSISSQGDISTNPSKIGKESYKRPDLLVLTHSAYFFNVACSNKVVKSEAAFSLYRSGQAHIVSRMNKYIAPFQQQLKDVFEVSCGSIEADHTTGNSIRSVLEAVGRFCQPDKTDSLTNFITFLAGQEEITIKSVMINNLSHGTYIEETPTPDDIKTACEETIQIVEKYAPGQIELVRD